MICNGWMRGLLLFTGKMLESVELPLMVIGNYRVDEPPGHWEQLRAELGQRQMLNRV